MILKYDVESCSTPGVCTPWVLRDELRADGEFSGAPSFVVGVTLTTARPPGEEIEIEYSAALSAPQTAAALAVVAAHDGTPP